MTCYSDGKKRRNLKAFSFSRIKKGTTKFVEVINKFTLIVNHSFFSTRSELHCIQNVTLIVSLSFFHAVFIFLRVPQSSRWLTC